MRRRPIHRHGGAPVRSLTLCNGVWGPSSIWKKVQIRPFKEDQIDSHECDEIAHPVPQFKIEANQDDERN